MEIMNLSEIMDKSIDILRKHIKTVVLFTLGYGIIAFLLVCALVIVTAIIVTLMTLTHGLRNVAAVVILITLMALFIAALVLSSYAGIIKISSQEYEKTEIFAHDAINASFKNIFKVFVIVFLAFLAFIPVLGVFGGVGYFAFRNFVKSIMFMTFLRGRSIIFVILPLLFILLFIFAALAYTTWFSFAIPALVVEKKGIIGALKKSFVLVRHNFWKMFGCTILFSLTIFAIRISLDSFFAIISSLVYLVLKFLNFSQDYVSFITMVYNYINWPLTLLLWLVISPIGTIMLSLLYYNQRFKKEGYDLVLKVKQLSEVGEFDGSV